MSGLKRFFPESPPAPSDKSEMSPKRQKTSRDDQWEQMAFRTPPPRAANAPPPRRIEPVVVPAQRIAVPEQTTFTENDSLQSLRAQVQGLRTKNTELHNMFDMANAATDSMGIIVKDAQAALTAANFRIAVLEDRCEERLGMATQEARLANEYLTQNERLVNQMVEKERAVRQLQRIFNDAINAILAETVE